MNHITVKVVYNKDNITETLGEVIEKLIKPKLELPRKVSSLLFFSGGEKFHLEVKKDISSKSGYLRFTTGNECI
jgi:hypothetical protein